MLHEDHIGGVGGNYQPLKSYGFLISNSFASISFIPTHVEWTSFNKDVSYSFSFGDTNAYAILYEIDPGSWYFYFSGLVYGRLFVTGKHTRKSDILNMLGSSRLSPDDVRFEYNMNYAPVSV